MTSCSASSRRCVRSVAWMLVLAAAGVACDQPLSLGVLAEGQSASRSDRQALEFELPAEFWNKGADGQYMITGFRLGFFSAGNAEPIATREVGRDAVVVSGRTGQVFLVPQRFAKDVGPVVLRLQTLTRQGASEWSAPSAAVDEISRTLSGAPAAKAGRSRSGLSLSEVDRHPRLAEALSEVVPSADERGVVVAAFRNVNELAQAVAICRDHDIALGTLAETMAGPPRRSLRNAVRELKPALQGTDALRKAAASAKQLVAAASKPQR